MGRFVSVPGMRPMGGEGAANTRPTSQVDPQRVIDSERGQRQLGEWLASRDSHASVGLDEKFTFIDAAGEARPALSLHEERDAHTGNVEVTFRASSEKDSGTYQATFEGADKRTLKQKSIKKIRS